MKNKKAFTLTELLVALGLIGAIAAMAVPSLMNAVHNRLHATQMKNITHSLQLLINNQLLKHKTKNLAETDFENAEKLLTKTNFDILDKCTNAASECWKTTSLTDKIQYTTINGAEATPGEDMLTNTVKLNNGALLAFYGLSTDLADGDTAIWRVQVDVNGNEPPNIYGRDFFTLFITKKGKIVGSSDVNNTPNYSMATQSCRLGAAGYCYDALVENGWVMPY